MSQFRYVCAATIHCFTVIVFANILYVGEHIKQLPHICPYSGDDNPQYITDAILADNDTFYFHHVLNTDVVEQVAKALDRVGKKGHVHVLEWLANNIAYNLATGEYLGLLIYIKYLEYSPRGNSDHTKHLFAKLPFPKQKVDFMLTFFYRLAFTYWLNGKRYDLLAMLHQKYGPELLSHTLVPKIKKTPIFGNDPAFQRIYKQTINQLQSQNKKTKTKEERELIIKQFNQIDHNKNNNSNKNNYFNNGLDEIFNFSTNNNNNNNNNQTSSSSSYPLSLTFTLKKA
ncbi:hypothetical protein DFA_10439 [Cavenderia fasciculata]|uniref:Uncharacterized protein n=1 Tax=Cavenderia fasciculata TaxID=261658 RepID=F4QA78_CACFS|nr:uncharacterized protein DFA_10439 [Cavenderia fasciculata]EGG15597.1 hypothetical protein DFA_10439 [Cavenderia fasciculata]|eukprot:XP_004354339.1 hypothetical protein DFA_10439 [Cavenderia fasciculata]